MAVRFYQLVIDARDPRSIARFWAAVLDQKVLFESDDEVIVGSDEHRYPGLYFVPVPEHKTVKNRLHIDLDPDELDAEVERIIALGARRGDVGRSRRDMSCSSIPRATSSACSVHTVPS
jgi:hypothetical protein